MRTVPPTVEAQGQPEPLRGVRRNMARVMAEAHAQVVPTTLVDDADLHAWAPGNDITVRLVRAIVAAARAVPALNAWFDAAAATRTLHRRVDIGIAVDTEDGLFVPALRNADVLDAAGGRAMKAVLLRVYVTLLTAAWHQLGVARADAPADPYTTLVGYFNALRELGGMRRLVEDEVRQRCAKIADRGTEDGEGGARWFRPRELGEPEELTSRESTSTISRTCARLRQALQSAR